jgi:starvation-inducible DNA-binding protein
MSERINLGIPEKSRKAITQSLSRILADTYTLYVKTHKFHWNVTGPFFSTLHTTFEEQYTLLQEAVDSLAERIRALGEFAPGSFGEFQALATIKEQKGVPNAMDMVNELLKDHETIARVIRESLPETDTAEDDATNDLLTGRLREHEKTAWMLRSILEG